MNGTGRGQCPIKGSYLTHLPWKSIFFWVHGTPLVSYFIKNVLRGGGMYFFAGQGDTNCIYIYIDNVFQCFFTWRYDIYMLIYNILLYIYYCIYIYIDINAIFIYICGTMFQRLRCELGFVWLCEDEATVFEIPILWRVDRSVSLFIFPPLSEHTLVLD